MKSRRLSILAVLVFGVASMSVAGQESKTTGAYSFRCYKGTSSADGKSPFVKEGDNFTFYTNGDGESPMGVFWGYRFSLQYFPKSDVTMLNVYIGNSTNLEVGASTKSGPVSLSVIQENLQKSVVCAKYE